MELCRRGLRWDSDWVLTGPVTKCKQHKDWINPSNEQSYEMYTEQIVKPNFTQRKTRKSRQFWHWTKLTRRILLENSCGPPFHFQLVYTQKSYTHSTHKHANIFTRIYLSYLWHYATLPKHFPLTQVDLTTADTAKPDHTFDISGFKPANVFFLTSDREVCLRFCTVYILYLKSIFKT